MRYAESFQRLLEYSAYDCAMRGRTALEADHLLLGLYREDFPLIDGVLAQFKVDALVVLDRLLREHPEAERPTSLEAVQLSPEALSAIALAEAEAHRLGHDTLTPPHTLLGILQYNRERLGRYFIRESIYRRREEQVLSEVRRMVSWLRFGEGRLEVRDVSFLEDGTAVALESLRLPPEAGSERRLVRLKMLKRFRATG